MTEQSVVHPKDKWIPWYFVIFFTVIAILDGIFVYTAVTTQTGVVTKQPYEKGLGFNTYLEQAKNQPILQDIVTYENGVLRWKLRDSKGEPVNGAKVGAKIIRPVQDGHDYKVVLHEAGNGVYETKLKPPLPGLWSVKLSSEWNNKKYQTVHELIAE